MYYVIQENLFKEFHYNTLIEHLRRYNLEFETIKYRPFEEDLKALEIQTDRKDIFFFGSVNAAMKACSYGWNPGTFYNENHDFEAYMNAFGRENMLNAKCEILNIKQLMYGTQGTLDRLPYTFFARPSKDSKVFSGQVFTKDSWNEWVEEAKTNKVDLDNLKIVVAPVQQNIQQEIRCWIVDGEPVTMSQYKIGRRVNMLNMDHNEEAYIFAKKMAKIFSPSRAFVLDICLHEDEYKVVEINCINCSGFYDLNMSKLIQSLEKSFG